jgi:hypothetical protein
VKHIAYQTSREMYSCGKNNKQWQSYGLENASDSVGVVMRLYCLGVLNEGLVLLSVDDLVSAPKYLGELVLIRCIILSLNVVMQCQSWLKSNRK